MKYSNWKTPTGQPVVPRALLEAGCPPLLAAILQLRGLSQPESARHFLLGGEEQLTEPLSLADMVPAVQRLSLAIQRGEHVAVYGDYDVDGITATCLLSDYLRRRGLECELYIPNRLTEGYGLNSAAIQHLWEKGVTLIVTVDCGVTNLAEAEYAASLGVDLIITDHHECQEQLPEAEAVVDPKRPDCPSGATGLAGVGVAFKLVCAMDGSTRRMLDRYCDLVAAGTVADVMPLLGENRFMVRCGLQKITSGACRPGFQALMEAAGTADKRATAGTIGHCLAPRINAAGRLGEAGTAVELLMTEDRETAEKLAKELCDKNRERQNRELEIWDQARAMLPTPLPKGPIVLAAEGWHLGVIGIVASRLTDAYAVPAVMISLDGDIGKGSCRSIGDFNLYEALSGCADCLEGFGGHAMAAGLTVRRDRVDELRRRLQEYYLAQPAPSLPALEADLQVEDPSMLDRTGVEALDFLEPCGNGNPKPLFYIENAALESVTPIGGGRHLRLKISQDGHVFDCVFFSQTAEQLGARAGQRVDILFEPQINEFRSRRSVQLVLTDLRPHRGPGDRAGA